MFTLAMMAGQIPSPTLSPADAVAAAHADLARLPVELRRHVRYLSGYNTSAADWPKLAAVLNGHANALSREPDITRLVAVGPRLLRVVLLDYGWKAETWDKIEDPFFTATVDVTTEEPWGYTDRMGRWVTVKTERKTTRQRSLAPWLADTDAERKALAEVVEWTQARSPVVRADYWLNQTATAADGRLYYEFLGVKDAAAFEKIVGSDVPASETFGAVWREATAISPVTLHARAFVFTRSLGGYDYRSLDFADNANERNPLRVLGKDIEAKVDAVERFAHLPNGLFAVGVFNGKGESVGSAPDTIASDSTSRSNDRRVHVGISCFRCHVQGGLHDVQGWVAALLRAPLDLRSPDYEKARQLRREYARDLQKVVDDGRAIYERSIKEASGLGSKEYAAALAWAWEGYEDARVDLRRAAADLGVTVEAWKAALEARAKLGTLDTVLAPLLVGRELPVRIWVEAVPVAHEILRAAK